MSKYKNLILLLLAVSILSFGIYISVSVNKSYSKNVDLDIAANDYNEVSYNHDEKDVKLDVAIPFDGVITNLEWLNEDILVSYITDDNKSGIKLLDSKTHKTKREIDTNIKYGYDYIHDSLNFSPSGSIVVYAMQDLKTKKIKHYVYDRRDKSKSEIGENFTILQWIPDSSGFLAIKDDNLIYYNIVEKTNKVVYKIGLGINIEKVQFSKDGTKTYLSLGKLEGDKYLSQIIMYEEETKKETLLISLDVNKNNWINSFDIIDDENILINQTKDTYTGVYLYNTKEESMKNIDKNNVKKSLLKTYLNEHKDKLINMRFSDAGDSEMVLDLYDINIGDNLIDISKLTEINTMQTYIDNLKMNDNKFVYSVEDSKSNKSMLYIYDILKNEVS